ncbi:hypothetical protein OR222_01360 [Wolbachia endosymbiont of Drosophila pseudotakahashii]|nr:hypothetical protein [Wolbachia endosymbiont of Drosophila pseudotakahashii]
MSVTQIHYGNVSVQQSGKVGRQDKLKNQEKVSVQQMVSCK